MLTAAHDAINKRDKDRLAAEVKSSGDPDQTDKSGRTLLMWAVIEGDAQLVETLIKCGASINSRDKKNGYSALHFAAQGQRPEIVNILILAGADLEARDNFGNTALNRATFYSKGKGETVKALLGHGANPNNENDHGVTPLSLAKQIANYDIAQFFDSEYKHLDGKKN
jgi:ankyrin repeat protein